jgi:hypothetical protein
VIYVPQGTYQRPLWSFKHGDGFQILLALDSLLRPRRDLKMKIKMEENGHSTVSMDLLSHLLPTSPCIGSADLEMQGQTGSSSLLCVEMWKR